MDINDSILNIKFFINNCVQGASRVLNPSHYYRGFNTLDAPCKFRYNSFDRKKFDIKLLSFLFLARQICYQHCKTLFNKDKFRCIFQFSLLLLSILLFLQRYPIPNSSFKCIGFPCVECEK